MQFDEFAKMIDGINVSAVLLSLAVVVLTYVVWKLFRKVFLKVCESNKKLKDASHLILNIVKFIFLITMVILLLEINGVNVTSAVAGLGIAGIIVGLALQDILKDVIMGLHITSDDFFRVGDVVVYNGVEGEVIAFSLQCTKIRSHEDGSVLTVSNHCITEISTLTDVFALDIPLPYEEKPSHILDVLEDICADIRTIPDVRSCSVRGVKDWLDSAVMYRLLLRCDPAKKVDIKYEARCRILLGLEAAGIAIPYNQVDVHTRD